jgi:hypothetical protein
MDNRVSDVNCHGVVLGRIKPLRTFRSFVGRCAHSRDFAEIHPQVHRPVIVYFEFRAS